MSPQLNKNKRESNIIDNEGTNIKRKIQRYENKLRINVKTNDEG